LVSTTAKLRRFGHIEIRVRDLDESAAFYRDIFGLQRMEAEPPSRGICVCAANPEDNENCFGIVLTEGLPPSAELTGMDHFSFEVAHRGEVDAIYGRAQYLRARATRPRHFDGHYQVYVFDPNGYKVEVIARNGDR
jgi:catechol 2,3-dioxygenase-like lactoylglutathione lyase family enzyme